MTTSTETIAPAEARPDWLAGRWARGDLAVAVLVTVVVASLAVVYRSPVVPTDPWHYVLSARQFPSTNWVALGYTRYGLVLSAIPLLKVFGNSQIVYYFWPIASSGVLAGCIYLLGRRWWGPAAGLFAVVLLIANTIVFYNLSRGYPDLMSMALFCLALVLSLLARDRMRAGTAGWAVTWPILLAGFCLGWGFEVRETSLLAWPLILVVLWTRGRLVGTALALGLPILAWAALDVGVSAWAYGDPLLKYHTLAGQDIGAVTNPSDIAVNSQFVNRPRMFYVTIIPKTAWIIPGGRWMILLALVAILALFVRNGPARLMAAWFIGIFGLSVLLGGVLNPAHPGARLDVQRYWIPFFPAIVLAVAAVVVLLARRLAQGRGGTAAAAVTAVLMAAVGAGTVVTGVNAAVTNPAFAPNGGTALEELRTYLASQPSTAKPVVWTDWETARILPIYQRGPVSKPTVWEGTVRSLTSANANPRAGDLVVLFSAYDNTCTFCRDALRPWLAKNRSVPVHWARLFVAEKKNLILYRVS